VDLEARVNGDESSALHLSVKSGKASINVSDYLLSQKADIEARDVAGFTPLHIAAAEKAFATLACVLNQAEQQGLIVHEADGVTPAASQPYINAQTHHGYTALHLAARGSSADGCTRSIACRSLIVVKADLWLESAAGEQPIHVAARWGDPSVCQELVAAGAAVDATAAGATTPLHLACDAARAYLESDDSPHADYEVTSAESPAKVGKEDEHATELAVVFSHHDCALQLLHLGANPHAAGKDGWTPLLISARRGNTDLCDMLIKMKGGRNTIEQCTRDGWGVVHLGSLGGSSSVVHLALRLGLNPKRTALVCVPDSSEAPQRQLQDLDLQRGEAGKENEEKKGVAKQALTPLALMELPDVRRLFQGTGLSATSRNKGTGTETEIEVLDHGLQSSENLEAVIKVLKSANKGDAVLLNPQCARSQQDAKEEKIAALFQQAGYF
jgi:ankyrin